MKLLEDMKLLKPLDWLLIGIIAIAAITAGGVAIYRHDHPKVTCHWQIPLKANYQACSDGTVREIK